MKHGIFGLGFSECGDLDGELSDAPEGRGARVRLTANRDAHIRDAYVWLDLPAELKRPFAVRFSLKFVTPESPFGMDAARCSAASCVRGAGPRAVRGHTRCALVYGHWRVSDAAPGRCDSALSPVICPFLPRLPPSCSPASAVVLTRTDDIRTG